MSHEDASYAQSRYHRYHSNNNTIAQSVKLTNLDVRESNEKAGTKHETWKTWGTGWRIVTKHETGDNVNIKETNLDDEGTISFKKYDEAKRDLFSRLINCKNDVLYTKHVFDNLSTLTSVELNKLNMRMLDHHDKLMSDAKHSQKILDQIVKEQLTRYRYAISKANY
jgi:hypothetical protein